MTNIDITIPQSAETMALPDPGLLSFYRNFDKRVLWIDDEIDENTLEFAKMIMQWNFDDKEKGLKREDRQKITLIFFTPGGDLNVNNSLIDTITLSETPIVGINAGMAASSGCYIYLACHERYTFPTAEFLLHKGFGTFSGGYNDLVAALVNYQRQINEIAEFVLSRTKIPEEMFKENFESDWYLSAKQAVELGVADRIITSLDEIVNTGNKGRKKIWQKIFHTNRT